MNFNEVFLTQQETEMLNKVGSGILTVNYIPEHLLSLGFISAYKNKEKSYVITPEGFRFLEFIEQKKQDDIKKQKIVSRRYWVSLIITNLISFAALIVSIIALSKK